MGNVGWTNTVWREATIKIMSILSFGGKSAADKIRDALSFWYFAKLLFLFIPQAETDKIQTSEKETNHRKKGEYTKQKFSKERA